MHSLHIARSQRLTHSTHSLFVVRDDRDCRHQLLHAAAASAAVVTKPLLLSLEWPFWKLQCMPWLPCNIQIKVKLKLVKANGRIDTKHKCLNCTDWEWSKNGMACNFFTVSKKKSPATLVRTCTCTWCIMWISERTVFCCRWCCCRNSHSIRLHLCLRLIMLCIHVRNRTECEITSLRND